MDKIAAMVDMSNWTVQNKWVPTRILASFLAGSSHENLPNSRDLTCRIITMSRRLFQRDRQTLQE